MNDVLKADEFELQNVTPQIATIYESTPGHPNVGFDNYIVLDMGRKNKGDLTSTNFIFRSKKFKITSTGATCGCTRPHFQLMEESTWQTPGIPEYFVTVDFDSNLVAQNTSKWFYLYVNNLPKGIKFNLVINKP